MERPKQGYWINREYFKIPNIENSYWAGFIAADGCIDKKHGLRIALQEKDLNHLQKLQSILCPDKPLHYRVYKNGGHQNQYILEVYSREIINDLQKNFNITPRKSLTLSKPNLLDLECMKSFVVGYIDGDGHISTSSKGCFTFSVVGTLSLMEFIKEVFFRLETTSKISIHEGIGSYHIASGGNRIKETLSKLKNISQYRMERKWEVV